MLTVFPDAKAFLEAVSPALEEHEAEHNLLLGLAMALRDSPPRPADAPFLAAVDDGAGLALAVLMSPSRPLVLASDRDRIDSALEPLWNALTDGGRLPRRVHAMMTHAESFAIGWQRRTGCATRLHSRQRLHALTEVQDVAYPSGVLRVARASDVPLIANWMIEFDREALGEDPGGEARERAERRVRAGEMFVWVDGEPRSMAAHTRRTTHGIAINAVYTPPGWRGRGYATGCVATLSARLLDEGRKFCVLFTNLANPTSNAIYTRIGYRGIRDFELYEL
jgi:GNAT superfamily N-acetyltransferase